MKLVISKNKDGNGYYTKLVNKYNNEESEMYLNLQLGKNVGELEYGLYEVDGFLSCYNSKEGVKPKLIITSAKPTTKFEKKEETKSDKITHNDLQDDDPFTEYGNMVEIDDNFLD